MNFDDFIVNGEELVKRETESGILNFSHTNQISIFPFQMFVRMCSATRDLCVRFLPQVSDNVFALQRNTAKATKKK